MKKVITLLVVLVISAVSLSACGKERTKTYEGEVNGKQVITSLTYKDDEVLKQSTIATVKYDDLGIGKDEAKQMFKNDEQAFKGIDGVSYHPMQKRVTMLVWIGLSNNLNVMV